MECVILRRFASCFLYCYFVLFFFFPSSISVFNFACGKQAAWFQFVSCFETSKRFLPQSEQTFPRDVWAGVMAEFCCCCHRRCCCWILWLNNKKKQKNLKSRTSDTSLSSITHFTSRTCGHRGVFCMRVECSFQYLLDD